MNKFFVLAAAALGLVAAGAAQAQDLKNLDRNGVYVGGSLGAQLDYHKQATVGVTAGYQVAPYARVELEYNNMWQNRTQGQSLFAQGIAQYRVPNTRFTPYALAGVGAGFNSLGSVRGGDGKMLYNLGGGVRYAVTDSIELDARYRNVRAFDNTTRNRNSDVMSVGVNYRF
tara:strand:+ start:52794 stop:53306 length:513 start_codon:yes stop_codon:yes gene_type:complete